MKTQLLCTFAHRKDLDLIIDYISKSYTISEKRMFVFSNADKGSELYVTYNVEPDDYKVNALNAIIRKSNNGVLDKKFVINWQIYNNSLMLTDGDDVRHIHLELHKRIDL